MGIKLARAPISHNTFSKLALPMLHGIEKLPGSFSFGDNLFWITALQSSVRATFSFSVIDLFFDRMSFRYLAYEGICVIYSWKGILI